MKPLNFGYSEMAARREPVRFSLDDSAGDFSTEELQKETGLRLENDEKAEN